MCKEMPVILVNKVADLKRKKWRGKEERYKGPLTQKRYILMSFETRVARFFLVQYTKTGKIFQITTK
jgi:hypothetical protein